MGGCKMRSFSTIEQNRPLINVVEARKHGYEHRLRHGCGYGYGTRH